LLHTGHAPSSSDVKKHSPFKANKCIYNLTSRNFATFAKHLDKAVNNLSAERAIYYRKRTNYAI